MMCIHTPCHAPTSSSVCHPAVTAPCDGVLCCSGGVFVMLVPLVSRHTADQWWDICPPTPGRAKQLCCGTPPSPSLSLWTRRSLGEGSRRRHHPTVWGVGGVLGRCVQSSIMRKAQGHHPDWILVVYTRGPFPTSLFALVLLTLSLVATTCCGMPSLVLEICCVCMCFVFFGPPCLWMAMATRVGGLLFLTGSLTFCCLLLLFFQPPHTTSHHPCCTRTMRRWSLKHTEPTQVLCKWVLRQWDPPAWR